MRITALVAKGKNKNVCDDAVLVGNMIVYEKLVTINNEKDEVCIGIADGVGGNAGGYEASQFLFGYLREQNLEELDKDQIREFLCKANTELIKYGNSVPGKESMATTFTGLYFKKDSLIVAHSGNTRMYVFQGDYLKQITKDHTTYEWLMMHGEFELAEQCNKSEIISCFGGAQESLNKMLTVDEVFSGYLPSKFLLTTDGIHEYVDIDTMESILCELDESKLMLDKILKHALMNGSEDDCSIVLIERI